MLYLGPVKAYRLHIHFERRSDKIDDLIGISIILIERKNLKVGKSLLPVSHTPPCGHVLFEISEHVEGSLVVNAT